MAQESGAHHLGGLAAGAKHRLARATGLVRRAAPEGTDLLAAAYRLILDREPDPAGIEHYGPQLAGGTLTAHGLAEELLASAEFEQRPRHPGRLLNFSLHWSRRDFVRSLPPAARILDLGGSWKWSAEGAFVALGYPYDFERLTIVDLPSDDRHPSYRSDHHDEVVTPQGVVAYDYRSMTDLDRYPSGAFDLVYCGQSIEHVTEEEGRHVLAECRRLLAPGGHLALDTPNGRVCRLQQDDFIDPDHELEYTVDQLLAAVDGAGLDTVFLRGLNYMGRAAARGAFSADEAAGNRGMFGAVEDCYLIALVATPR